MDLVSSGKGSWSDKYDFFLLWKWDSKSMLRQLNPDVCLNKLSLETKRTSCSSSVLKYV